MSLHKLLDLQTKDCLILQAKRGTSQTRKARNDIVCPGVFLDTNQNKIAPKKHKPMHVLHEFHSGQPARGYGLREAEATHSEE